jgi:hypothetical protein
MAAQRISFAATRNGALGAVTNGEVGGDRVGRPAMGRESSDWQPWHGDWAQAGRSGWCDYPLEWTALAGVDQAGAYVDCGMHGVIKASPEAPGEPRRRPPKFIESIVFRSLDRLDLTFDVNEGSARK